MWEALKEIANGPNAWVIVAVVILAVALVAVAVVVAVILVKKGAVSISTDKVKIGGDQHEREIIRQQVEFAHLFVQSIEGKISPDTSRYGGYFTKYILERVYDEVVDWITFNHLTNEGQYISIKQTKVTSLVYSLGVTEEFKTPEFKDRMNRWVDELICGLVQIRKVYN